MGKKLGKALIIYGVVNFIGCLFFGPVVAIAGFVWMLVFIGLGKWQIGKAKDRERQDRIEKKLNTVLGLPEEEKGKVDEKTGIRYIKD